jgi:EAL domain-containing protein (putative c-di-GMP-specific phosphodiesterase class I)/CheY-like chemotaxis protein
MDLQSPNNGAAARTTFGQRHLRPRACVIDVKEHIRTVLEDALENLGFVTCECARVGELALVLDVHHPNLVVIGLSIEEAEADEILRLLAGRKYGGNILLLGPADSRVTASVRSLAEEHGLAVLPTLHTPFNDAELVNSVASLLPATEPPSPPVKVAEAVDSGWLELWYQPEIDTRTLALHSAEALARIRHPAWGVVPPAYFIPEDGDPHFRALSEYVIGTAINDWGGFAARQGPMGIAINLPVAYLEDPAAITSLCERIPHDPAFEGLIVEINGTEVVRHLGLLKTIARRLRFHNIAISVDDVGAEWPQLAGQHDFPFVELKVDRKFVAGCANDMLKRSVCRAILDLAAGYGARTVAEGVETRADFLCVREMGFDKAQGFLFARPSTAKKFARTMLGRPITLPH